MKAITKYCIFFLLVNVLFSCEPKWDFESINFEPQIVVEGWIEDGEFPTVILTQTKSLNVELDSTQLSDIPIRWAKVTVSDGTTTEILTGRKNNNYLPPFIYTGSEIRGEAGKSYTLTVEYSGKTVTAKTSIPKTTSLDSIIIEKCSNNDTLYQVKTFFTDNPDEKNYYKIFTRIIGRDKHFYSSFMGTFDDSVLGDSGASHAFAYRGMRHTIKGKYTPFFNSNSLVLIKFTQVPLEGFEFWSSYESEITNSRNPLFPSSSSLKSNIVGGLGIWCGYGAITYQIVIREKTIYYPNIKAY